MAKTHHSIWSVLVVQGEAKSSLKWLSVARSGWFEAESFPRCQEYAKQIAHICVSLDLKLYSCVLGVVLVGFEKTILR